jgi:threonine dehydrogenase-like Zn-dependent dehydrogenase
MCLQARALLGARPVIVLGRREAALDRARAFGADHVINTQAKDPATAIRSLLPGGVDVAVDAVGHADLLRLGLEVLAEGGVVGSYGVGAADAEPLAPLQQDPRVRPGACDEGEVHEELLGYVQRGLIDPTRFITHRLPLEQLADGFDLLAAREALKVVVML